MNTLRTAGVVCVVSLFALTVAPRLRAHDGPPYPIVSNQSIGPYVASLWTDPDTTDDGTAGGQFWVMVRPAEAGVRLPDATRAGLTMRPLGREGPERTGQTAPVDGDVSRQFVALVMDHEGRFGVRVTVDGPLGAATFDAEVEGTYDARPAPAMLFLYLAPFVLIGGLWIRVLHRRRQIAPPAGP